MKKLLSLSALVLVALCVVAVAAADPGDSKGKGGKHAEHGTKGDHHHSVTHGKFSFTVVTTDGGSCGVPWANDTVKRTYTVKKNHNGGYTITRRDRGTFVTTGPASPGSCETTGHHGKTVRAGVTGKLVGFIRGTVSGGTFNPSATCTGGECGFTDTFVATYFGAGAQFSCYANSRDCSFNFEYSAAKHQTLLYRHWQDKGKGAGTMLKEQFHGDIADA